MTTLATKSKHNTIHPNEERLEGSLLTGMADKMLGRTHAGHNRCKCEGFAAFKTATTDAESYQIFPRPHSAAA